MSSTSGGERSLPEEMEPLEEEGLGGLCVVWESSSQSGPSRGLAAPDAIAGRSRNQERGREGEGLAVSLSLSLPLPRPLPPSL